MSFDRHLIHVRFDLVISSTRKHAIGRYDLPQVPLPGETINVDGYPYVVLPGRGWSIGDDEDENGRLYAFVDLVKYGDF